MTAAAIKTGNESVFRLADGNNGLVAIALHSLRANYALRAQFQSAYALERVVHTFEFISQLRLVAHMQKAASPAAAEVGAGRLDPLGRRRKQLLSPAVHRRFCDLHYPYSPALAGYRARHEHSAAAYPAHARAFRSEAGDFGLVYIVFSQFFHNYIVPRCGSSFNLYQKICNFIRSMLS